MSSEELLRSCRTAIAESRKAYDQIAAIPLPEATFENVIRPWIMIEARFSVATAGFTFGNNRNNLHVNSLQLITEFEIETCTREDLFQVARAVSERHKNDVEHSKAEEVRFLRAVLLEFKHYGLEISDSQPRAELKAKRQRLSKLSSTFISNLNNDASELFFTEEELAGAPKSFLSSLRRDESTAKYRIAMKHHDVSIALCSVRSETVRCLVDKTYGRKCEANRAIFAEIIKLRQECARLLGYPDHATFRLEAKMAKTPEVAEGFLQDVRAKLTPFAQNELEALLELKKRDNIGMESVKIHSWDFPYYSRVLKEAECSLNEELIREYFGLNHVIQEAFNIFDELFGLKFVQVKDAFERKLVWHQDVALWEVWNSEKASSESFGGNDPFIGHVYLDLLQRTGKSAQYYCQNVIPGHAFPDGQRQYPVTFVNAGFVKPAASKSCLLNHTEVVHLFHELGHALHNICSRVQVARFHGTKVERDFVETPSQMLENLCWNPVVLKRISSHHARPEEKLPDELIAALIRSKNQLASLLYLYRISLAILDLQVHGDCSGKYSGNPNAIDQLYESLRNEISLITQPDGIWPMASFLHMVRDYDAGYYGYLWSEFYSADIFHSVFVGALNSSDAGLRYRREVLQVGGSRDAMDSLVAFLGRRPDQNSFLNSLGVL